MVRKWGRGFLHMPVTSARSPEPHTRAKKGQRKAYAAPGMHPAPLVPRGPYRLEAKRWGEDASPVPSAQ